MELKIAKKEDIKLRVGISGNSGTGKTYSALLMAYGITGDWTKVAIIDTENMSADLYANLGPYNVLNLFEPFSPERYRTAIKSCENANMEVIIIDSISHEWNGPGGCLEMQSKMGGRFTDWARITPLHQGFLQQILTSKCHIITTTRRKVDYSMVMSDNGKSQIVNRGTKEVTRDGYEYELTVNFELINNLHQAKVSKDRTGIFGNKGKFMITSNTGRLLEAWTKSNVIDNQVVSKTSLIN